MKLLRATLALTVATLVLLVPSASAQAGTISLAWNPVDHPNLAGYRVYYDTTPGAFGESLDVGAVTAITLSGITDCTNYEIAVKAYDDQDVESETFSNPIVGWARPVVTSVLPSQLEQNAQGQLTIDGNNFMIGTTVLFDDPAITVANVTRNSCSQLVVDVNVGSAAQGAVEVRVLNPDQVFGLGLGLFSIGNDSTPPSLSAVAATDVGATTATIGWNTDEPATSQVFYRLQGESEWQAAPADANLVTTHGVTLEGLWPDSTYDFYVQSTDGAGNTASSSPSGFTTTSSSYSYLRFEAEGGQLGAPLTTGSGAAAFADGWIEVPSGTSTGSPSSPSGTATYGFSVPNSGTWYVWVRIFGTSGQHDSWFEKVDGASFQQFSTPVYGEWNWVEARSYSLTAGQHTFALGGREDEARADRILVTDDPGFVPTEQPGDDSTPPNPATGFTANAGDGVVDLDWTNPSGSGSIRVVVRFRTDGVMPTSPVDGQGLVDSAATPGAAGSFQHAGLTNGTTYTYAVFIVDASGNPSQAATAQATPAGDPPPPVDNLIRTDTM